jgi:hypothetical protein
VLINLFFGFDYIMGIISFFDIHNTPSVITTLTNVPMAEIRQGTMALRIEPYNLRFESS